MQIAVMTTFVQEYIFSGIIQEIENKMSRAGYGIQIEVAVQPQAHGLFFDVHSQSPVFGSPFVQHFVNIFQQGRIALAHTALHVGRSEMGDQYSMCSAFGNDTLAYVSGGIEVEVGEVTNQYIRPVGLRLCHIFPGVYSRLPWVPK